MRLVAAVTLALLAASCGPTATPCTTCMNVQGKYLFTIDAKEPELSSCDRLYIGSSEREVEIFQTGSELDLPAFWGFEGTLFDDDSARLGPVQVPVSNSDAMAKVTLTGAFTGEEAQRRFSGTLSASTVLDKTSCSLTTTVRGVKMQEP